VLCSFAIFAVSLAELATLVEEGEKGVAGGANKVDVNFADAGGLGASGVATQVVIAVKSRRGALPGVEFITEGSAFLSKNWIKVGTFL